MSHNKAYIAVVGTIFAAAAAVLDFFPRSAYSELEKRELSAFPVFSADSLRSGAFTRAVSAWFSDTEPFRDAFMTFSMKLKDWQRLRTGAGRVTFHAAEPVAAAGATADSAAVGGPQPAVVDENARIVNSGGIVIAGEGGRIRGLVAFGGGTAGCKAYADAANLYAETFGPSVRVYLMVIPTAIEFYCPPSAARCTRPQRPVIEEAHARLAHGVRAVDVYPVLQAHAGEDIYLRTDHHWAPLGAYYAAREFARVAGVAFRGLDAYERRVVRRYVGSMYGYSREIGFKDAPEDFVFYVPHETSYTTTYVDYTVDDSFRITAESRPHGGPFFQRYRDGSSGAYCTFMGSDKRLTKVETSAPGGRRLLILKDSFGNALPGYLFYSFEEIHVVDSRYFLKNMKAYVAENDITDILFANNIFKASSPATYRNYVRFLSQPGTVPPRPAAPPADAADAHEAAPAAGLPAETAAGNDSITAS
ncbi:MAG: hypothetical protein J1F06_00210 [Prevotellaceae bacterium]|nr:hypothetical protein [Prevotellaceae bacterium]